MSNATENHILTLHALTFLHPGTGQTTGVVDLPIQREVHTGFPMIASSGLKGSLREKAEQKWNDKEPLIVSAIFGREKPEPGEEAAGALIVTDARILAFPVRSLQQVFVWITCPMVLKRLRRDLELIGAPEASLPVAVDVGAGEYCTETKSLLKNALVLEEMRLEQETDDDAKRVSVGTLAEKLTELAPSLEELDFKNRFAVVGDDDFQYLVRHATHVSARIALNDRKTTSGDGGNLWYEETLPPETLMYTLLMSHKPRYQSSGLTNAKEVMDEIKLLFSENPHLQVGGNETVGQGWCKVNLSNFSGGGK